MLYSCTNKSWRCLGDKNAWYFIVFTNKFTLITYCTTILCNFSLAIQTSNFLHLLYYFAHIGTMQYYIVVFSYICTFKQMDGKCCLFICPTSFLFFPCHLFILFIHSFCHISSLWIIYCHYLKLRLFQLGLKWCKMLVVHLGLFSLTC